MSANFESNLVKDFLVSSKESFLNVLDSKIKDKSCLRIISAAKAFEEQAAKAGLEPGSWRDNALLLEKYNDALAARRASRREVIKSEVQRIQKSWPMAIAAEKTRLTASESEARLKAAMERMLMTAMYPNGYIVNQDVYIATKNMERNATANALYKYVLGKAQPLALEGQTEGRIAFADLRVPFGKLPELRDIKTACSMLHGQVMDSLAVLAHRSGHCFLDVSWSQSEKKGIGIKWQILNYE